MTPWKRVRHYNHYEPSLSNSRQLLRREGPEEREGDSMSDNKDYTPVSDERLVQLTLPPKKGRRVFGEEQWLMARELIDLRARAAVWERLKEWLPTDCGTRGTHCTPWVQFSVDQDTGLSCTETGEWYGVVDGNRTGSWDIFFDLVGRCKGLLTYEEVSILRAVREHLRPTLVGADKP